MLILLAILQWEEDWKQCQNELFIALFSLNHNGLLQLHVFFQKNFSATLSEEIMKEFPGIMVRYHQFKKQQYTIPERK